MAIKQLIPENVKAYLRETVQRILNRSLKMAAREQGLDKLASRLEEIVPDITDQYSRFKINNTFLRTKVRCQHSFQISLVQKVINEFERPVIVDVGDSAGTHLQYIMGLYNKKKLECLSVNLDLKAVERIKEKGLKAVHAKAEDLPRYDINADIFLCFEILEHLMNPCFFLHELSEKTNAKYLVFTVPYRKESRVGLSHIRSGQKENVYAENTHIFELNPEDWKLISKHSGWDIVEEGIFLQYPRMGLLRVTQPLWKYSDFEGFYGLILKRDNAWSSKYEDW
ncbi:MAG: hypothetical protein HQL08_00990 [Nitrospirae bacterium]|nr:hypothetical protein [Nitrospirota bacterium]